MAFYAISSLKQPRFGEVVREGRMRHGWRSYRGAQAATGIPPSLWCDAEAGRFVSHPNLVRLLEAIDVP